MTCTNNTYVCWYYTRVILVRIYHHLLVRWLISYCVFFCACLRIGMANILFCQMYLRSNLIIMMSATISASNWSSFSLYLQLFVGWFMSYLHYFCLLEYSGVHTYCIVFSVLFVFVLCLAAIADEIYIIVIYTTRRCCIRRILSKWLHIPYLTSRMPCCLGFSGGSFRNMLVMGSVYRKSHLYMFD